MRYIPLALFLIAACGPPAEPAYDVIGAGAPETYYLQTESGRTLYFDIPLINETDSTQTLYLFAYAADNVAQPPARAVYPPRALASMPSDRRFSVGNPLNGLALTLPPGDSVRFSGALPIPATWPSGEPITSRAFRDLSAYAYDAEGHTVFSETWSLFTLKGEERVR